MAVMKRSIIAWCVCIAAFLVYVVACITPAIDFGPQRGGPEGLHGTTRGSATIPLGLLHMGVTVTAPTIPVTYKVTAATWLANPLGLFGLVLLCFRISAPATVLAGMA